MIRIYLDDGASPVIQANFRDLFSGKIPSFVSPFTYGSSKEKGPHWSYIPIPYAKFCKILISELTYYQIEYVSFAKNTRVETYNYPPGKAVMQTINEAAKSFVPSVNLPFKTGKKIVEKSSSLTVPAGDIIQMASYAGPGIIKGLRLNWGKNSIESGRDLVLKVFWDGEEFPSVYAPVYDFFGGKVQTYAAGAEKNGTRYCYFPMPFRHGARLEVENNGNKQISLETAIYIEEEAAVPGDARYFHASWNRNNDTKPVVVTMGDSVTNPPGNPADNYTALEVRGQGHLAGITLFSTPSPESDAMIFIDGNEWPPRFADTGQDGLFDLANGYESINWPLAAGYEETNAIHCQVRLFMANPVSFSQGAVFSFEHGSANMLRKDYTSTVYWYQNEPHKKYPWLLPVKARGFKQTGFPQPVYEIVNNEGIPVNQTVEAENLQIEAVAGHYEPQDMLPFGPDWSGNQQIYFRGFDKNASIQFQFPRLECSGWYKFECTLSSMPDGGNVDAVINNQNVISGVQLYSSEVATKKAVSKRLIFLHASDMPKITFIVRDKQPQSKGYSAGIDAFGFYPAVKQADTLTIQGPLGVPGDRDREAPQWITSADGTRYLLGYYTNEQDTIPSHVLTAGNTGEIDAGSLLTSATMNEGLCLATWKVNIENPGIYRLDIAPMENTPFLLLQEAGKIKALKKKIMVNKVVVHGDETTRFDPGTGALLPYRFKVPLKKGGKQFIVVNPRRSQNQN